MLSVEDLAVSFGTVIALDGVSLEVADGSTTAILGPSGCGKSTLLRVIAGLQRPDRGHVRWNGRDITAEPPHQRRFGLMFQDYALFPHRSVGRNVAFGLEMRGEDPHRIASRVDEVLEWVGLPGFGPRPVTELSGGEQQRVALARAMAPDPELLLLDEPVGSLDRLLRSRLVRELGAMLADAGTTAIYVTHDQDEALALADHLVVMKAGRIVQQGPPTEVWRRPADAWVAGFLGFENVFESLPGVSNGPVVIHADAISLGAGPHDGTIVAREFHGSTVAVRIRLESGDEVEAHVRGSIPPIGEVTPLEIDPAGVVRLARGASPGAESEDSLGLADDQ